MKKIQYWTGLDWSGGPPKEPPEGGAREGLIQIFPTTNGLL